MDDPIMEENFRKLLNELAPLNRIPIGRPRPIRRQKAKRPMLSKRPMPEKNAIRGSRRPPANQIRHCNLKFPKTKNDQTETSDKTSEPSFNRAKNSRQGQKILTGIPDAYILSELTDEDATLRLMKMAIKTGITKASPG